MNASDPNFWPAFLVLGVPLIILAGGPYGWRFLVLLGALAGLVSHPLITLAAIGLYLIRAPLRWAAEGLIIGFTVGIGARLAGTFNSPERAERLREKWVSRRRHVRERGEEGRAGPGVGGLDSPLTGRSQRGAPRARGRRPRDYFPFNDPLDLGD